MKLCHLILLIASAILFGCKPADKAADATTTPPAATSKYSIVGSWTDNNPDSPGTVVEFKDDGTLEMTGTSKNLKNINLSGKGIYKIDGDKMSIKVTDLKLTPTAGADAATKKEVADEMKKVTPESMASQPAQTATIVWKDKDTFTSTNTRSKKAVTFTRKAS